MSWLPSEERSRRPLLLTLFLALAFQSIPLQSASPEPCPAISRILIPADSGYYVGNPSEPWLLVCGGDTLLRGDDFQYSNGIVRLADGQCRDTLRLLLPESPRPEQRRYYLHELITERSPTQATAQEPQEVVATARVGGNLKVAGTKTFAADLSDRRQAALSQGLALTLSGDLGHGITVRGSFSDRGLRDNRLVTRRFSELENVYLEVESASLRGRFGSFDLVKRRFHFLQLSRQVQGLEVQYRDSNYTVETTLSLPPGNFTSNSFALNEGDYGPYFLNGPAGELGIAVVEHSETVWLNGRKLERGRDEDYYLDYLQGELIFTGRRNVDAGDRVRVDFEYQKREYRKTLLTGAVEHRFSDSTVTLGLGVLSLIAANDDPLDFTVTAREREALAAAGDNPELAEVPGAQFVGAGAGSYELEYDSLYGEIYSFVGDSLGDYQVSFSKVESGNYLYLGGGQYLFVGIGHGDYLPIRSLPLPEAAHLVSLQSAIHLSEKLRLGQETAISIYDRNRVSVLDDGDNHKVATKLRLGLADSGDALSGSVSAELLPGGFYRSSRLESVDEDYLWQRQTETLADRQRYLAEMRSRFSEHDEATWELGYTREVGGFRSLRGHNSMRLDLRGIQVRWELNLAGSDDTLGSSSLIEYQPEIRSTIQSVQFAVNGYYDLRTRTPVVGEVDNASRRELGTSLSYGGVTLRTRQRENWSRADQWQMLARKRSLALEVHRTLNSRGRLDFIGHANWLDQVGAVQEVYQTGSLDLDLPRLANLLSINTRLRLSRRGYSETRETFLQVEEGEGDYILQDSTYVADSRGDYLRVTEQVGSLSQTVEAEKQIRLEFNLTPLALGILTNGSSLRYETNSREIGDLDTRLQAEWLLPPTSYFSEARFSRRRHSYRLRRREESVGLSAELEYQRRHNLNRLDIARPSEEINRQGSLLLSQRVRGSDLLRLLVESVDSREWEADALRLDLKKLNATLSYRLFLRDWEYETGIETGREVEDSLDLKLTTFRLSQKIAYKIGGLGRVDVSGFVYRVQGDKVASQPRQITDGFPVGTNLGARLRVDFRVARHFSLKLSASGEVRDGEDNRYFLRSELISRFE